MHPTTAELEGKHVVAICTNTNNHEFVQQLIAAIEERGCTARVLSDHRDVLRCFRNPMTSYIIDSCCDDQLMHSRSFILSLLRLRPKPVAVVLLPRETKFEELVADEDSSIWMKLPNEPIDDSLLEHVTHSTREEHIHPQS